MSGIIMIQGTASGVGKSILATALCRIFEQDGYKTAPFKAQNMSTNFHVLDDGKRIARSQAIAAYACNTQPRVEMNPILLMPEQSGTKMILLGKDEGSVEHLEFHKKKSELLPVVLESFKHLSKEYEMIVIEGAGSPVELNLIKDDLVNMGLAEKLDTPVILVTDIVRGGIFASLYGTLMLLPEQHRRLVKGIIVNKFKGDMAYFEEGARMISDLCKVPVLGVIPYTEISIEDEDSLTDDGYLPKKRMDLRDEKTQEEFDILADLVRRHLDMESIYKMSAAERKAE